MAAQILDGKAISKTLQLELGERVAEFVENNGFAPTLAAVLVGQDAASEVYVRNKRAACERVGLDSQLHRLAADVHQEELLDLVAQLNRDETVHGILVQLPLPRQLSEVQILDAIHPLKDVDAFHPMSVGLLSQGRPRFLPCTPHGVLQILHRSGITVAGRRVAIVGRSDIVGKPLAMLLGAKDSPVDPAACNGTVTLCHSRTPELATMTRQAEILVAAIGRPKFITADMVRPGAAVIDVGINRTADGIVGDVDFEAVREVAGQITPVPGGVGPLTVTMLLHNTLRAAELLLE